MLICFSNCISDMSYFCSTWGCFLLMGSVNSTNVSTKSVQTSFLFFFFSQLSNVVGLTVVGLKENQQLTVILQQKSGRLIFCPWVTSSLVKTMQ